MQPAALDHHLNQVADAQGGNEPALTGCYIQHRLRRKQEQQAEAVWVKLETSGDLLGPDTGFNMMSRWCRLVEDAVCSELVMGTDTMFRCC